MSLVVNADQDQDGNKIINSLQPGKGTLYLLKCQEVSITIHLLYNSVLQDSNDTSDDNVNLPPGPTSQVVVDLTEPDPTSTSVVVRT